MISRRLRLATVTVTVEIGRVDVMVIGLKELVSVAVTVAVIDVNELDGFNIDNDVVVACIRVVVGVGVCVGVGKVVHEYT